MKNIGDLVSSRGQTAFFRFSFVLPRQKTEKRGLDMQDYSIAACFQLNLAMIRGTGQCVAAVFKSISTINKLPCEFLLRLCNLDT